MEIKITLLDKICVALFYMLLASGPIGILIAVITKLDHGYAYAGLLVFVYIWLWLKVRDIFDIKEGKKLRERDTRRCSLCKYKQENDK